MAGGQVIDNPITGERIVIRQSGADTEGRLLSFDLFLPPGGHVPATHAHPVQEERFTVIAGQMRFRVGRRIELMGPGDTVVVTPWTAHWFGAAADVPNVTRAGCDVPANPAAVRARIGLVTDSHGLHDQMTPSGYLDFFGQVYGLDSDARHRQIEELLSLFELQGVGRARMAGFSGGMPHK